VRKGGRTDRRRRAASHGPKSQHLVSPGPDEGQRDTRVGQNVAQAEGKVIAAAFRDEESALVHNLDEARQITLLADLEAPAADRAQHQERAAADEGEALLADMVAQFCLRAGAGVSDDLPQSGHVGDLGHCLSPRGACPAPRVIIGKSVTFHRAAAPVPVSAMDRRLYRMDDPLWR